MAARRPRCRLYAIGVYFQNAVRRNAGLYRVYHAELLDDDAYCALQMTLLLQPQAGPVIRGTGGLRKLRWSLKGIGKRGGIRVIYYWDKATETFYMLLCLPQERA